MVSDARITYRRRHSYNTASNKYRVVKTPGGRLTIHYTKKSNGAVKCFSCKKPLAGIPCLPTVQMRNLPSFRRTVFRAYGGNLCHRCLRDRILRAFLAEEQKIVKKVALLKSMQKKESPKKTKKSTKKSEKH